MIVRAEVLRDVRMLGGLSWWMRAYEFARALRRALVVRRGHRRTDPACRYFAGEGVVRRVLGVRVPSIRRLRFDRGRGRSCPVCMAPRSRSLATAYSSTAARVREAYAATHLRLALDPVYRRLSLAAAQEFELTPELHLARNRLAVYVELHTPWPEVGRAR